MLARTPDARATRDVDLLFTEADLDAAEAALVAAAGADLGDFFRFVYKKSADQLDGGNQRYIAGRRVVFEVYLGAKRLDPVSIDLVVGADPVGTVAVQDPVDALLLPRLVSASYRIYPIVDHVADKVCAILETRFDGAASSREKDLVDLVVIAVTEDRSLEAGLLGRAIRREAARRNVVLSDRLSVPQGWGAGYRKLVAQTVAAASHPKVSDAVELMAVFLDPVLAGGATGTWSGSERRWMSP